MRATINFDIDLKKVEDTMAALVSQEAGSLHITANILDNLGHGPLLQEITEALDLLQETTSQLQQYRQMLVSFEQAKYQTMSPPTETPQQPEQEEEEPQFKLGDLVRRLREAENEADKMTKFDNFIGRIREAANQNDEEDQNVEPVPEG